MRVRFAGTVRSSLTCQPAPSSTSAAWVPAGTARDSSARKTCMAAVETSGSTRAPPSPRSGQTAPNRCAEAKPCCRTPRGRTPFWYQTWVRRPFWPTRASSMNHSSTRAEQLGVHRAANEPDHLAGAGMDEAVEEVEPLVAGVPDRDRPPPFGRPLPAQHRLQPEPVLVEGPHLDLAVRVLLAALAHLRGELFLYAACSSAPALGCRGLGTCGLWPSFRR